MLAGKKILVSVTGSIAAYKAVLLVRLLVKEAAEVKVVMTNAATEFVAPLTFSTLSKNEVIVDLTNGSSWANHVMLGRWADVMIIAPLSCNTLAKMAHGFCDNLLTAVYLSATCPVMVAPAMDEDMWKHPSTKKNLATITSFGNSIIPVNNGELASGLFGEGRMAEPETILHHLQQHFSNSNELKGLTAIVTAGPTYEAIDPVRFVGNHSSGKMGFAIAEALYQKGASVHLITGPTHEKNRYSEIKLTQVVSAEEMYEAATKAFPYAAIAVMAAAVADYKPVTVATQKIKKSEADLSIKLEQTKDILKTLGEMKQPHQLLVGFALETNNEEENALKKLHQKNADLIVLNSLQDAAAGFGKDTNKVTIFDKAGNRLVFDAKSKSAVALDIVQTIIQQLHDKA
jgi:phosphopantothenoylcysteine decarboxylase/phosphopantothenate--cysteine ligase